MGKLAHKLVSLTAKKTSLSEKYEEVVDQLEILMSDGHFNQWHAEDLEEELYYINKILSKVSWELEYYSSMTEEQYQASLEENLVVREELANTG